MAAAAAGDTPAARRMEQALARIDGPVDTKRERQALAKARGFAAELRAMGVDVEHAALIC